MKRELSPVTQKSAEQTRDTTPPHKSRKAKGGKDSPITPMNKVKTSPSKSTNWPKSTLGDQPLAWTADGREALMQHLIAEVLKSCDKTQLAEKFGVTRSKLHNELSLERHGNMRDRAVKAARR